MNAVIQTIQRIQKQVRGFTVPIVTIVSEKSDPYLVLISCVLSLRTKDTTTAQACRRLFRIARTPRAMITIPRTKLEKIIYPVGFYHTKAGQILAISRRIITEYGGKVPGRIDALLRFKGVGRKTANLVLGLGFGIPAICVDTHVHRISNRLGWVKTQKPEETEYALATIVPKKYWIALNTALVTFGQNVCLPVSPWCSRCAVRKLCKRVGVARSR